MLVSNSRNGPASHREHGGAGHAEIERLGIDPAAVLDFSVNVNPYGPCPAVIDAIRRAPLGSYPEPTGRRAREAVGRMCVLSTEHIVLGNGASDLLWTLARILISPGTPVVIVEPTFSEFRAAAVACGGSVVEWRAPADTLFSVDLDAVGQVVRRRGAKIAYLCLPNNPTGRTAAAGDAVAFAIRHDDLVVVVDQSFLSLSESADEHSVRFPSNVILVRSLTKDHAIPGVRVGYLVTAPEIADQLEAFRPAWTTSTLAQAAAVAAARSQDFVAESRRRLLDDRDELASGLRGIGLFPLPTAATFLLTQVPGDSATLHQRLLLRHGILVRDCGSFGLAGYIRIAARPLADRLRLCLALEKELEC